MHVPLVPISFTYLPCSFTYLVSHGIWVQVLGSVGQWFLNMVDHHFTSGALETTHTSSQMLLLEILNLEQGWGIGSCTEKQ